MNQFGWRQDQSEGQAGVDLSSESAGVGSAGLLDGFWVRAFPKSYSGLWYSLSMAVIIVLSDGARSVCVGLARIDSGTF